MAGIHQTLKEARSLYAEALKLQEAVLASHRDLEGCVAQVQTWHEQVKKWLAKHPRFHFHFKCGIHFIQVTPTSCGWVHGASASQSATIDRYGVGSTATACCTRR